MLRVLASLGACAAQKWLLDTQALTVAEPPLSFEQLMHELDAELKFAPGNVCVAEREFGVLYVLDKNVFPFVMERAGVQIKNEHVVVRLATKEFVYPALSLQLPLVYHPNLANCIGFRSYSDNLLHTFCGSAEPHALRAIDALVRALYEAAGCATQNYRTAMQRRGASAGVQVPKLSTRDERWREFVQRLQERYAAEEKANDAEDAEADRAEAENAEAENGAEADEKHESPEETLELTEVPAAGAAKPELVYSFNAKGDLELVEGRDFIAPATRF